MMFTKENLVHITLDVVLISVLLIYVNNKNKHVTSSLEELRSYTEEQIENVNAKLDNVIKYITKKNQPVKTTPQVSQYASQQSQQQYPQQYHQQSSQQYYQQAQRQTHDNVPVKVKDTSVSEQSQQTFESLISQPFPSEAPLPQSQPSQPPQSQQAPQPQRSVIKTQDNVKKVRFNEFESFMNTMTPTITIVSNSIPQTQPSTNIEVLEDEETPSDNQQVVENEIEESTAQLSENDMKEIEDALKGGM